MNYPRKVFNNFDIINSITLLQKWIKNHLHVFLSIFVILFLVKGGIVILSIIFLNLF